MSKAQELKPCPFCGAGETLIHANYGEWTGHGYGEPVSVEVRHWCTEEPGQPSLAIIRVGRDVASAISAWNLRAPASSEQQAAQQDAERDQAIGRAVQRACKDLPEGSEVVIHLEKGAGTVYMTDWDGNEYDHFQSDEGFGDVINQAVDGAIAADTAARASNGGKA